MNRAERQHRKLVRYEAWLRAQIEQEPEPKLARALKKDHRTVLAQLEDASEDVARRGKRARDFGFGVLR